MQNQIPSDPIFRGKPAANKLGVAWSTFCDWRNPDSPRYQDDPPLPNPIPLGKRAVGWRESSLDGWLDERAKRSVKANRRAAK